MEESVLFRTFDMLCERLGAVEDGVRQLHDAALYAERTKVGRLNSALFGFGFELHRHAAVPELFEPGAVVRVVLRPECYHDITEDGTPVHRINRPIDIAAPRGYDAELLHGSRHHLIYLQEQKLSRDRHTVDQWVAMAVQMWTKAWGVSADAVRRVDLYARPRYVSLQAFRLGLSAEQRHTFLMNNGWHVFTPACRRDAVRELMGTELIKELGVVDALKGLL